MNEGQKALIKLDHQQQSMLTFDNYFLRGLLTVNVDGKRKPLYIAEYHTGGGPDTPRSIAVYKVAEEKQSDGTVYYDKAYTMEKTSKTKFSTKTLLGKLAQGDDKPEEHTIKRYELPVFVTLIEQGTDTFTHKTGDGFWELERGHFDSESGNYELGDKTGVFICLDSFKWHDAKYRFNDVTEALNDRY